MVEDITTVQAKLAIERARNSLARHGVIVLRFWSHQVRQELDSVVRAIWLALEERRKSNPSPSSSPFRKGRGEIGPPTVREAVSVSPTTYRIQLLRRTGQVALWRLFGKSESAGYRGALSRPQQERHRTRTFQEEYSELLRRFVNANLSCGELR
jgi:hypothetical protein